MQQNEATTLINIGTGEDCTIAELASLMRDVTNFRGAVTFDTSKPDGTPRKLLDVTRIRSLGWKPRIPLREGLQQTFQWAVNHGAFAEPVAVP